MNRPAPSFRLDQQFEQQAVRTPRRVAVHDAQASITFTELDARANRLLSSLRVRGIAAGSYVGVHMERSPEYVVSVLAILKANAAVVPLPPAYPENRLRDILAFAKLDLVLDAATTPLDPSMSDRLMRYGDAEGDADADAIGEPDRNARRDADLPAFVLCSSGSTGIPKLIVRSHRSFFHRLQWTWDNHPFADGEVCCQKSHMATTHAIYELFEPLLRGAPVCLISDSQVQRPESFWNTLHAQSISRLLIVPSLLQASLDMPDFVAPPLKVLVLMGEYVPAPLAQRVLAAFPAPTRVFSIYGSTEASSTLVCDLRASFQAGSELPLGAPISPDVHVSVLGADGQPVASGEVGILHVAGPPLFSGYFKAPALTAAVIPAVPSGEDRRYNTHDQVRRMADGTLQFVGRIDHTVKIRGFRVDLQEVEQALLSHPEVRHCAVIASDAGAGSAMLLAFVVPATIMPQRITAALRECLPAYMIPSVVTGLDALPLTASGKVDRQRLLAEHAGRVAPPSDAFASDTERAVAAVWAALLAGAQVGPDSSFFEVGGTSLSEFAAVRRLRDAFGLDRHQLADVCIYQHQTVTALAAHIDRVRQGIPEEEAAEDAILSTLKRGDTALPPLFAISSAGGTLGAYDKLVRALDTRRSVIGVRDPLLWDARDAAAGFQRWIAGYVTAIRGRQPRGPYYLLAYSSAGAFGYEIAQHLRRQGETVALLALVDPLAMDRGSKSRFGYWALQARFMRPPLARVIMLAGRLRRAVPRWLRDSGNAASGHDMALTPDQVAATATQSTTSKDHILAMSALLELNSGLPFALANDDLRDATPAQVLPRLLARVKSVAAEIGPHTITNIVIQYNLQVRAHHQYRLQRYPGKVVIFEPRGPCNGLLAAQFAPYLRGLEVRAIALGEQSARTRELASRFPENIRSHYLSMRDDGFANTLAGSLAPLLQ